MTTKRAILMLAVIAVAAVVLALIFHEDQPIPDILVSETSGVVASVQPNQDANIGTKRVISVQLKDGAKVIAPLPEACVVLPGQTVKLRKYTVAGSGQHAYVFLDVVGGSET